jgi:hypothetical protein
LLSPIVKRCCWYSLATQGPGASKAAISTKANVKICEDARILNFFNKEPLETNPVGRDVAFKETCGIASSLSSLNSQVIRKSSPEAC